MLSAAKKLLSSSGSGEGSNAFSTMELPRKVGFTKPEGPVALIILDGVGIAEDTPWNAFSRAHTPFVDSLKSDDTPHGATSLYTELDASGLSVGLPTMGDMGNSEVGHNALGAGRVFQQGAKLVNTSFATGAFKEGEIWKWLVECKDSGTLHLLGLFSDGNVHAHVDHVYQLIDAAVDEGVKRIRVHPLADGRDVSARSVLDYIGPLEKRLEGLRATGVDVMIASGGGRMVLTMDRYEADWSMVERGWKTHVLGDTSASRPVKSYSAAVTELYEDPTVTDQYLPGFVIVDDDGKPVGTVEDGDSLLLWNFRGDRAIEISTAFESPEGEFPHFDRMRVPKVRYAGMMEYDGDAHIPAKFLVSPPSIDRTVPEYVVKNGLTRYSLSETQKYGHVTYFYNGNRSAMFDESKERYVQIPSYTQKENTRPWMKCAEITDAALAELDNNPDLMVINYPGGDMVGHCGVTNAARICLECIDLSIGLLIPEIVKRGGVVVLTADHGNCEIMAELDKKTGQPKKGTEPEGWKPHVSHTTQKVPCYVIGQSVKDFEFDDTARWGDIPECESAGIVNLGATVLNLLGLEEPADYLPGVLKMKE